MPSEAQAASHAEEKRHGCQEESELHQLRRGMAPKGEGHRVEHLHALWHHVVESDPMGESGQPDILVSQAEVVRDAIGESLGVAKLHLDLRRGDGPPGARWYNFAALTTT